MIHSLWSDLLTHSGTTLSIWGFYPYTPGTVNSINHKLSTKLHYMFSILNIEVGLNKWELQAILMLNYSHPYLMCPPETNYYIFGANKVLKIKWLSPLVLSECYLVIPWLVWCIWKGLETPRFDIHLSTFWHFIYIKCSFLRA